MCSGSDSAPHPTSAKQLSADGTTKPAAGVYTQSYATQYILLALEDAIDRGIIAEGDVTQERLEKFLSSSGRRFYKLPEAESKIILERKGERIVEIIKNGDGSVEVALSRGGAEVFSLKWAA